MTPNILPNKHISINYSLLGIGGHILYHLQEPQSVSSLWEASKGEIGVATFKRFVLALTLLYTLGAVEWKEGLISRRVNP